MLKILAYDGQVLKNGMSARISEQGGSIGRSEENALVLPDKFGYVSRVHAKIEKRDQQFFIADCSSNGTFLFHAPPLSSGGPGLQDEIVLHNDLAPLNIGCHINIGGFEIEVQACTVSSAGRQITEENKAEKAWVATPEENKAGNAWAATPEVDTSIPIPPQKENYTFEALLGITPVQEGFSPPKVDDAKSTANNDVPAEFAIDDFFTTGIQAENEQQAEQHAPPPTDNQQGFAEPKQQAESPKQVTQATEADSFFQSIGMDVSQYPPNTRQALAEAGTMYRTLLVGTMALMKGRTEFKRQISSQLTSLQKEQNNPVKFCESVDELLPYLFNHQTSGFIPPQQAIQDCEDDLLSHQMALMAGIQAGLQMAISKFDPVLIENNLNDAKFNKPTKCWDLYSNTYQQIAKQAKEEFFGEEFRVAYEQQIKKIKGR